MTRALVITMPEKGHYHPLLAPAVELAGRGIEVAFATTADIREELLAAGVPRALVPPGAAPPPRHLRGELLARLLADPAALHGWIRELLVETPGREVESMRAIIRDFRPDVVAIDTMSYEGAIAASLEGVPWVGWATSLNPVVTDDMDSELLRTTRALEPERQAVFRSYGLEASFRVCDVLSPLGTATFTTRELVGVPRPGIELVGPSLGGARLAERADLSFAEDRPLIYISFGSQAWHQPRRYDLLLDAVRELDAAVLLAMGDLADEYAARPLPSRVRCVRFAPQLDVLRRARAVVTHGGANSVMEALAFGVPILIAPLCNDQPHNRIFLERAGAGIGMDLEQSTVAEVAASLRAVLAEDGGPRAAARRIAKTYAARSGARGAADLAARCLP